MEPEEEIAKTPEPPGTCGCEDVCSLPSDQLRDRTAMFRRELWPKVIRRRRLANGWRFDFAYTPAMERTLEDLVAFERRCCDSLSWNLDRPKEDVLRLRVEGLPPGSPFFDALGGLAHGPRRHARARHLLSIAVAGGFGAAASLLVCCAGPMIVAAVLGGAVAAPLAMFDRPLFAIPGALAAAIPVWLRLRRRARARRAP